MGPIFGPRRTDQSGHCHPPHLTTAFHVPTSLPEWGPRGFLVALQSPIYLLWSLDTWAAQTTLDFRQSMCLYVFCCSWYSREELTKAQVPQGPLSGQAGPQSSLSCWQVHGKDSQHGCNSEMGAASTDHNNWECRNASMSGPGLSLLTP